MIYSFKIKWCEKCPHGLYFLGRIKFLNSGNSGFSARWLKHFMCWLRFMLLWLLYQACQWPGGRFWRYLSLTRRNVYCIWMDFYYTKTLCLAHQFKFVYRKWRFWTCFRTWRHLGCFRGHSLHFYHPKYR